MKADAMYPWDDIPKEKYVLAAECSLARNGLTTFDGGFLQMFTKFKEFDGFSVGVGRYIYNEDIDYENFVTPMYTNELLLLPNRERALIEYLQIERWRDEGILIEALKSYRDLEESYDKLYKMAEFYGYPAEELSYWINEAETDEEV